MKRALFIAAFVVAAAGLSTLLYFQWRAPGKKESKRRGKKGSIAVEVATVKTGTIISKARYIGSLMPRSQFIVAPQIGGRLSQLKVRIGDKVKPKQLLAIVDNEEVIQQVEQALAEVRVARAQLDEQNARLVNARAEYRRELALAKKRLNTPAQREKTESSYKVEAAKVRVIQAQLAQKRSLLKAARVRLSYTKIYAQWVSRPLTPAQTRALMEGKETIETTPKTPGVDPKKTDGPKSPDGKTPDKNETTNGKKTNGKKTNGKKTNGKKTNGKKTNGKKTPTTDEPEKTPTTPQNHDSFRMVGERFADEGSLVQPNAKLLSLIDIRTVVAVIYATEKDYIDLKVGQVATARTYVYKNRQFTGHVVRIAPLVKESSRLARIELEFPNPDLALKPGMFVRIEVNLETADNSTLIPRSALVRHQEKDGVFSVDPNTRTVKFIPIKIGIQEGGMVQVLSPALSGQVVTMGYHLLRDGAQVTVAGRKKRTGTNKRNGKSSNGSRD